VQLAQKRSVYRNARNIVYGFGNYHTTARCECTHVMYCEELFIVTKYWIAWNVQTQMFTQMITKTATISCSGHM